MYDGAWTDNNKDGIGKMTYKDQGTYYGYWKEGKRSGEGVFTYPNQDLYSGNWANGNKEGQGTFIFFETGMKMFGTWKEGNFMEGKWIFPNGTYFQGKYDNNRPKGKGTWHFKNGNEVEGDYSQMTKVDPDPAVPDKLTLIWNSHI